MSAPGESKLRPMAVRTLLLVGANPDLEVRLEERLESGTWAIERVPNNAAVLMGRKATMLCSSNI